MITLQLTVDGPFSLSAAASFGFGPGTGRPFPDDDLMTLAFVTDDLRHQVGILLRPGAGDVLQAEVHGAHDLDLVEAQVRRILSIDQPVEGWIAAGRRDPVLGAIQARFPGLRPVLFHSPYEAAAWSVISQRRHRTQAASLRARLAASLGASFDLGGGRTELAFPLPERLLTLESFPGLEPTRLSRLRTVAECALDGRLDAARLSSMRPEDAVAQLRTIPGLGPVYANLVELRATGVRDVLILDEPRLRSYLQHYHGLAESPGDDEVRRIAELWRPFRTWAGVLTRVAGDRDGLTWEDRRPARRRQG